MGTFTEVAGLKLNKAVGLRIRYEIRIATAITPIINISIKANGSPIKKNKQINTVEDIIVNRPEIRFCDQKNR